MKHVITVVLLVCSLQMVHAQSEEEYEVIDDYSQSGGILESEPEAERYEVNEVMEFPILYVDLNQLIGGDVLEVGKKYSFTFNDVPNLFSGGNDIKIKSVVLDCSCEEASWIPSIIAPGQKGSFSGVLRPAVSGPIETTVRVYLTDLSGLKPAAIQRIQFTYNAQ